MNSVLSDVDLVDAYCDAGGLTVTNVVGTRPETDPFVAVIARQHP